MLEHTPRRRCTALYGKCLSAASDQCPAGEDYPCGGRLLLFEVARDEGAAPGQERWKLVKKYVRCAEQCVGCAAWSCRTTHHDQQILADVANLRKRCSLRCLLADCNDHGQRSFRLSFA